MSEVTIMLGEDDKKILQNVDELRFKQSIKPTLENQVILKVADAAIEAGFIEAYQPPLINKIKDRLQKINEMELRHRNRVKYQPYVKDQLSYSEICQMIQENPSVVAQLNNACQGEGFHFAETTNEGIQIYRTQDDVPITIAGFTDDQLESILTACEKILDTDKVQETSSPINTRSTENGKHSTV